MRTSRIASVLGCLSIGVCASLGACKSSSHANGSSDHSASSGGSGSAGSSGSSGSGDGGEPGDSSGGGSSSGGSSGVGSSGTSGSSSGADDGGSKPYIGLIAAVMQSEGGQSFWTGAALFAATGDAGGTSGCAGTQSGDCCYTPPGSAAASTPAYVSAGDIVVKDGSNTIATMSPGTDAGPMNAYDTSTEQDAAYEWAGGDTLSFTVAGGTVDAFSATVVAPGLMQNITPALSATSAVMVQGSSDFTFTWTPGDVAGNGSGINVVATSKSNMPDGSISCVGMDSAGSLTVPQALLAKMTSGDTLQIVLTRLASSTVATGNASVVIAVGAETLGVGQLQ